MRACRSNGIDRAGRGPLRALALGLAFALAGVTAPAAPLSAAAASGEGAVASERLDVKAETFRRWLPAALAGNPTAQYEIGVAFATGLSAPEDLAEAAKWYRRAADQGHAAAQNELAILHVKGLGVPQDYVAAYVWFALAADSYGIGARRDQALEIRDMMAAFMTPAQLEEARTEVRRRREGSVQ